MCILFARNISWRTRNPALLLHIKIHDRHYQNNYLHFNNNYFLDQTICDLCNNIVESN